MGWGPSGDGRCAMGRRHGEHKRNKVRCTSLRFGAEARLLTHDHVSTSAITRVSDPPCRRRLDPARVSCLLCWKGGERRARNAPCYNAAATVHEQEVSTLADQLRLFTDLNTPPTHVVIFTFTQRRTSSSS
jgi:hypothetical protein